MSRASQTRHKEVALSPLSQDAVAKLRILPGGVVDLRRDVYHFVDFVQREGIKRRHRDNCIPKGPAAKLAKLLSWSAEAERLEQRDGAGYWSDYVSQVARDLGLVKFDIEGVYAGYSSSEPSFPDNFIEPQKKALSRWLANDPLSKERALVEALVGHTENEFFKGATLIPGARFDRFGCATGPASRMDLRFVRKGLLKLLAGLPTDVWLPISGLVQLVQARMPELILPAELRVRPEEPNYRRRGKRNIEKDDLYENFRERSAKDPWGRGGTQLSESSPNVFARVQGRYLQFFLQEIPYLCGFVDLAEPISISREERQILPPLQSLAAFRIRPRLRQVVLGEPEIARVSVTVMPNFDVLVEAPSYPEKELDILAPLCKRLKEEAPIHLLQLDRRVIVEHVANHPGAPPPQDVLTRLSGQPLPANVLADLQSFCGHAEKLTVYDNVALVELRGSPELKKQVKRELGQQVMDEGPPGFILARDPDLAVSVLEQRRRVPIVASHTDRWAAGEGPLGASPATAAPTTRPASSTKAASVQRRKASLTLCDFVGCRTDDAELRRALAERLRSSGVNVLEVEKDSALLVPASDLPKVRAALGSLSDRFDVQVDR